MKKKGFTLVELLVVIAIIALLMGILMPALARVRQIAYRLYCGTNLSGIGKAILIYANDYEDDVPAAGGPKAEYLAPLASWSAIDENIAYNTGGRGGSSGRATISSCFFLLIKYADVTPKSFLCKGDAAVTDFKVSESKTISGADLDREIVSFWDFDAEGREHCSYAYSSPFGDFSVTTSSDPGMPLAADPNPWIASPDLQRPIWNGVDGFVVNGTKEQIKQGNALTHQSDGQNVLYVDGHTSFEKESYCGVDLDNIYTIWAGADKRKGVEIGPGLAQLNLYTGGRNDALLVQDPLGGRAP